MIISTADTPFHGEQFVALTLSTKTWYGERIPIDDGDLIEGGLPKPSSILPWAVASIADDDVRRELKRLRADVVDATVTRFAASLGIDPERAR
ncbi:type II toxin-antitoxin system PemK/MazF family toxin [Halovivax sp.]|uniref:type II toxin-antitoxin system PemK/MazF family toxin n=1 Tax=Halovivax sp. TaxID=1935978 RepID=UPI0025BBECE8|nr:type II toxin-antitoxin system PemK/MazF family toxin [Halovivax sp.]